MINKFISWLKHKLSVRSWEKGIHKETQRISIVFGIQKDSNMYQQLLKDVANGVISENDILYNKKSSSTL